MEFVRLQSVWDPFFADAFILYSNSFPKHEQRRLHEQALVMGNHAYHCNVVLENRTCVGILFYWKFAGYAYIEHFAIQPSMRGKSKGSGILGEFCKVHPFVVLEIDLLTDETAMRRKRFYEQLGFNENPYTHRHPAYQQQFPPHQLIVMSYPKQMSEAEYQTFRRDLEETVMKIRD